MSTTIPTPIKVPTLGVIPSVTPVKMPIISPIIPLIGTLTPVISAVKVPTPIAVPIITPAKVPTPISAPIITPPTITTSVPPVIIPSVVVPIESISIKQQPVIYTKIPPPRQPVQTILQLPIQTISIIEKEKIPAKKIKEFKPLSLRESEKEIIKEFINPIDILSKNTFIESNVIMNLELPISKRLKIKRQGKEIYHIFEKNDSILLYTDPELEYHSRGGEDKRIIGWGQRKLGLTILQFLTLFWDSKMIQNPVVVYAGAATGENISFVSKLLPKVQWHLYDPVSFNIVESNDVLIYKGNDGEILPHHKIIIYTGDIYGWFSDQVAKKWEKYQKKNKNVFFISDIRSGNHEKDNTEEFEEKVKNDMIKQSNWHKIIKPIYSQLKFRLPYDLNYKTGLPKETNYMYQYLDGLIYKQSWVKPTSTETRLVTTGLNEKIYDFKSYESKLFYFNREIRGKRQYLNPIYPIDTLESSNPVNPPELLNDWDSINEIIIWINYLKKLNKPISTDIIKTLSNKYTSHLDIYDTGKSLSKLRSQWFKK